MSKLSFTTPIDKVFMIGPTYARRLNRLNIFTAKDLLHHYPFRHQDLSQITTINKLQKVKESEKDEDHWWYKDCPVLLDKTEKLAGILKQISKYDKTSRLES